MKGYCSKLSITEFGAIGDGKNLNTQAIQSAIDHCFKNGGGTVVVPPGAYISGTIELKSNITLYLEPGAVLKGSNNISDYVFNGFLHNEMGETLSLIYAIDGSNICITGQGEIDLSDCAFMDFNNLFGCSISKSELDEIQFQESTCSFFKRPNQPLFFHNCNNISFNGISIRNSPCWTLTTSKCRNIKIHNLIIENNLRVPNSDAIHISSSKNVIITDCILICGDDCIAITGITDWDEISEHIVVSNCIMRSRSAAVRVGHLASKVRDVLFNNITIHESNRGIAIFAGDDGWVRDVSITNVNMDTHIVAGCWWGKGEPLVISAADSNGVIEGISISNIKAHSENGIIIVGSKKNVKNIDLNNWRILIRESRNRQLFGKAFDIQPAKVRPIPEGRVPWIYAGEVDGLKLSNIQIDKDQEITKGLNIDPLIEEVERLIEDHM